MDSPVRKQQKRNDYLRHKMFRKINRRKKAERKQAIEAPMKELRRRLRRYGGGKKPKDDIVIKDMRYGIIPFLTIGTALSNYGNEFKNGKSSGIHIKPENRGKFTALKKRTGKSASWFKAHGTPAQKKMATFALNAKKWKH